MKRAVNHLTVVPSHVQQLEAAVHWLVSMKRADWPSPIVPELQRRFGLSPKDACTTLREFSLEMAKAR
ncbi:hypothetical protein [Aureimonas flava]|uniref:hypothetical protein n=1 Tax=Aureimonas flava TaxID=2320271 RepID=UPI0010A95713|nr:hypothetical protein [Aureimonas flava]